jgi:hypothetical protein
MSRARRNKDTGEKSGKIREGEKKTKGKSG